mmetsp:Transcript_15467/g.58619  ORF Transcript_15467/g.58619 Transcript_15467/m.58619 type:complete len:247 (+) Transcript_15467:232-972(+)
MPAPRCPHLSVPTKHRRRCRCRCRCRPARQAARCPASRRRARSTRTAGQPPPRRLRAGRTEPAARRPRRLWRHPPARPAEPTNGPLPECRQRPPPLPARSGWWAAECRRLQRRPNPPAPPAALQTARLPPPAARASPLSRSAGPSRQRTAGGREAGTPPHRRPLPTQTGCQAPRPRPRGRCRPETSPRRPPALPGAARRGCSPSGRSPNLHPSQTSSQPQRRHRLRGPRLPLRRLVWPRRTGCRAC